MNKYILKPELSRPKIKVDFLKQHMLKKNFSAYQRKKPQKYFPSPLQFKPQGRTLFSEKYIGLTEASADIPQLLSI